MAAVFNPCRSARMKARRAIREGRCVRMLGMPFSAEHAAPLLDGVGAAVATVREMGVGHSAEAMSQVINECIQHLHSSGGEQMEIATSLTFDAQDALTAPGGEAASGLGDSDTISSFMDSLPEAVAGDEALGLSGGSDTISSFMDSLPDTVNESTDAQDSLTVPDTLSGTAAASATSGGDVMSTTTTVRKSGPINQLAGGLEDFLKLIQQKLRERGVANPAGLSIIVLTACVKIVTLPFTKQQVESSLASQALQPRIKEIKRVFKGDKEKIQKETSRVFQQAEVNPYSGCLPLLITWPVFIGLYRCFTNAANEGLFDESFLWLPSLAGPTSIANRTAGLGLSWLGPLQDGSPPIGWHDALLYLTIPAMLITSQYTSMAIISPPADTEDDEDAQGGTKLLVKALPLMIGYFALNVPSGLGLYWLTNNILTTVQQVWLRKFGGASVNVVLPDQKLKYGTAIRTGFKEEPNVFDARPPSSVSELEPSASQSPEAPIAANGDESPTPEGQPPAAFDMQATVRAKRSRKGKKMQVYTPSQKGIL